MPIKHSFLYAFGLALMNTVLVLYPVDPPNTSEPTTFTRSKEYKETQKIFAGKGVGGSNVLLRLVTGNKNETNITRVTDVDCIVNAANEACVGGGGVDGAVHDAANVGRPGALAQFIGKNFPLLSSAPDVRCQTGHAIATPAFAMEESRITFKTENGLEQREQNIKCIVHTVGPRDTDSQRAQLLRSTYHQSLNTAIVYAGSKIAKEYAEQQQKSGKKPQELTLKRIAFPSISTGAYGYPLKEAAIIALGAVTEKIEQGNFPFEEVRFVLHDDHSLNNKGEEKDPAYTIYAEALKDYPHLHQKMEDLCKAACDQKPLLEPILKKNDQANIPSRVQNSNSLPTHENYSEQSWLSNHWPKVVVASSLLAVASYMWWKKK